MLTVATDSLVRLTELHDRLDAIVPTSLKNRRGQIGELAWALMGVRGNISLTQCYDDVSAQKNDSFVECKVQGKTGADLLAIIRASNLPCCVGDGKDRDAVYVHLK